MTPARSAPKRSGWSGRSPDEERNSEKGWERFQNEQICRLKIRQMKEEWAKDLVAWPWCISQVVKAHEDCPELQAVLDEYHKPVVIQDQVLGELKLDKDYDTFEGEIQWCGKDVLLSLEVNAESKPSWTRARSAAKKLLADCETWDKAMRELAAKNLTELPDNWLSQDEENPRNPKTDPITEEELARRISMTSLSVTSGGSFTAWFDCDEMFTDHAVTVYGSLKKGPQKLPTLRGKEDNIMKLNCKRIDFYIYTRRGNLQLSRGIGTTLYLRCRGRTDRRSCCHGCGGRNAG